MKNGPKHPQFENEASDGSGPEEYSPALEAALRQALKPVSAPAGFADRVMARALEQERYGASSPQPAKAKLLHWPQSRLWITGAVAAALLAGVFEGGVAVRHVREQQRRVVEATRQFQTTERITVRALAQAREQLQKAGVPLNLD